MCISLEAQRGPQLEMVLSPARELNFHVLKCSKSRFSQKKKSLIFERPSDTSSQKVRYRARHPQKTKWNFEDVSHETALLNTKCRKAVQK